MSTSNGRSVAVDKALAQVYPSDLAGVGGRKEYHDAVLGMPRNRLMEAMEDPDREDAFIRALDYGLKVNDRTSMRIYAEARKLVGTQVNLAVVINERLGAPLEVGKAAVESMDRAKAMSPRMRQEAMAKSLRDSGWSVSEPDGWSSVEVVETNGNGHVKDR